MHAFQSQLKVPHFTSQSCYQMWDNQSCLSFSSDTDEYEKDNFERKWIPIHSINGEHIFSTEAVRCTGKRIQHRADLYLLQEEMFPF